MKRFFNLLSLVLGVLVFAGCENLATSETGKPEIKKVLVSDSLSNLTNGIERDTFTVGETAYFGLTITDTDLDLDKIIITQKSASQNIDPLELTISVQVRDTDFYSSSMNSDMPEVWTIEGYAVDKKGNRSNTVTKTITVKANLLSDLTVIFDTKGGTDIQSASVASGSTLTKPDDPEKAGHSFDGWHKDEQYSAAWDFENDVVTSNITLYARWTQNKIIYPHEVSKIFHAVDVDNGSLVFIFWTDPDDENFSHVRIIPSDYEGVESSILDADPGVGAYLIGSYPVSEYVTIKSIGKNGSISNGVKYYFDPTKNPDALTVTFYSDGGIGVQPIIVLLAGDKITKPDDPVKSGYSFDGWYKDEQYSTAWDFENDVVTVSITLYAKWSENKIIYPYEVSKIFHVVDVDNGSLVFVLWTDPDDENFSHVRIIPSDYEGVESSILDADPGVGAYLIGSYPVSEYVTIKSIGKNGSISNGVKYYLNL